MELTNNELSKKLIIEFEEFLYRVFKLYKDPNKYYYLEKLLKFNRYCFLSERFYKLYEIMISKYPELKFDKEIFIGEVPKKGHTLFINDCISDLPNNFRLNDEMLLVVNYNYYYFKFWRNAPLDKDYFQSLNRRMKRKSHFIVFYENKRFFNSLLGLEIMYLKCNKVKNYEDYIPDCTKQYFIDAINFKDEINYYITSFYTSLYSKKQDELNPKVIENIRKEVAEETKEMFKDRVLCNNLSEYAPNREIIDYFANITYGYYEHFHYPIELDYTIIEKLLDYLDDEKLTKDYKEEPESDTPVTRKLINK